MGRSHFGTPLVYAWIKQEKLTVMTHPIEIYQRLKRRARRLILKGDMERYMRTLRALHDLRTTPPAAAI